MPDAGSCWNAMMTSPSTCAPGYRGLSVRDQALGASDDRSAIAISQLQMWLCSGRNCRELNMHWTAGSSAPRIRGSVLDTAGIDWTLLDDCCLTLPARDSRLRRRRDQVAQPLPVA
jgi:hypothetical protein